MREEMSALEALQIAMDAPFVRLVSVLIAGARRDMKFCAE